MARTRVERGAPPPIPALEAPGDETDELLLEFFDQLDREGDIIVKVYRQPGTGQGRLEWLFDYPIASFSYDEMQAKLRDTYGAGNYRIHVRQGRDMLRNHAFSIGGPKPTLPGEVRRGDKTETDPVVGQLIERMDKMQTQLVDALNARNAAPAKDPLETALLIIDKLGLAVNRQPQLPPPADPLEQIERLLGVQSKLKELMPPSGEESETSMGTVLVELIKTFGPPLAAAAGGAVNANIQQAREPRAGATRMNDVPQSSTLKANLALLVKAAERNGDPETYANMVLDMLPDQAKPRLYAAMQKPDALDTLVKVEPRVAQHREFFEALRAALLDFLGQELGGTGGGEEGGDGSTINGDSAHDESDPNAPNPEGNSGNAG